MSISIRPDMFLLGRRTSFFIYIILLSPHPKINKQKKNTNKHASPLTPDRLIQVTSEDKKIKKKILIKKIPESLASHYPAYFIIRDLIIYAPYSVERIRVVPQTGAIFFNPKSLQKNSFKNEIKSLKLGVAVDPTTAVDLLSKSDGLRKTIIGIKY